MGADKEMCDARGLKCIDMVEKEIKKLKRRIRKEGLATSPIPSATTSSGGSSTVETPVSYTHLTLPTILLV